MKCPSCTLSFTTIVAALFIGAACSSATNGSPSPNGGAGGAAGTSTAGGNPSGGAALAGATSSSNGGATLTNGGSGQGGGPQSSGGSAGSFSGAGAATTGGAQAVAGASSSGGAAGSVNASGPYDWSNATMLGGGFVSGIIFSPVEQNLIYARTDIGGFYRWNSASTSWIPISDGLPYNQMGGESLAADPLDANVVYAAGGMYINSGNGVILRSNDRGNTWTANPIPVPMGGNADGRSMGERLAIDPNDTRTLYFASRTLGLWKSSNQASSWNRVTAFPVNGNTNLGLSFVTFDATSGSAGAGSSTLYVGVASTAAGSNLYRSVNAGSSFALVPGGPSGLMPHHAVLDASGVLYLTYDNGPGPNGITAGAVWKFDTKANAWTNVTPPSGGGGFGGVSLDAAHPGTLVVSTLDWWNPDEIYRSTNAGASWTAIGRAAQHATNGAEYLCFGPPGCAKPSSAGWMGDIELDPFDSTHVMFITGQGIWESKNANAASAAQILWTFQDKGLEETAVIDMTSSVNGALFSAVGDIGGFRHADLSEPSALGMYNNPVFGNTTGIDFAGTNNQIVARVGSGSGRRGAYSTNNGQAWTAFGSEPAGSTGQGSVAVSAEGATFVWAPSNVAPAYSVDHGTTWRASSGLPNNVAVASDRVNGAKFYAMSGGTLYVSSNGGMSFAAGARGLSGSNARARAVFGSEGEVWVSTGSGLYHSTDSGASATKLGSVQSATSVGFGKAAPGKNYPSIYLVGTVANVFGVFRSDDVGQSWLRINDAQHQFGALGLVAGDEAVFGRVYLGTNGRGIPYGEPNGAAN